jgi:hypothetical protein
MLWECMPSSIHLFAVYHVVTFDWQDIGARSKKKTHISSPRRPPSVSPWLPSLRKHFNLLGSQFLHRRHLSNRKTRSGLVTKFGGVSAPAMHGATSKPVYKQVLPRPQYAMVCGLLRLSHKRVLVPLICEHRRKMTSVYDCQCACACVSHVDIHSYVVTSPSANPGHVCMFSHWLGVGQLRGEAGRDRSRMLQRWGGILFSLLPYSRPIGKHPHLTRLGARLVDKLVQYR